MPSKIPVTYRDISILKVYLEAVVLGVVSDIIRNSNTITSILSLDRRPSRA